MNKVYDVYVSQKGEIEIPEEVLAALGNPQEIELSSEGNDFLLLPSEKKLEEKDKPVLKE